MAEKEILFRKKRELGDIISDSFLFLKSEFRPLSKIILLYVVPFIILYAIIQVNAQQKLMDSGLLDDPESLMNNIMPFYKNVFLTLVFNIFVQSLFMAAFYSYIEVYVNKGKGNFTISDVTPILFSNSILALGVGIVISLIVFIGAMMCFLPGIYFANTFSLVIIILLFEKKGLSQSLKKSWNLVNSQWWNTFLLNIIAIIITAAIGFVISIPTMISGFSNTVIGLSQPETIEYPNWYWILSGFNSIISSLLYIIPYTFLAFQYFNLEERSGDFKNPPLQIK